MKNKKTELKSKNKVNTKVWIFALVLIIFFIVLITVSLKNNVSKLKGELGSVVMPANAAFIDNNFYRCVVNAYNKENNTNHGSNYNLSDAELAKITKLDCGSPGDFDIYMLYNFGRDDEYFSFQNRIDFELMEKNAPALSIADFTGIEKMPNILKLKAIHGSYDENVQYYPTINLDNSVKLQELDITEFYGTGIINLSKNVNLEKLTLMNLMSSDSTITGINNLKKLSTLETNLENAFSQDLGSLTGLTKLIYSSGNLSNVLEKTKTLSNLTDLSLIFIDDGRPGRPLVPVNLSELPYAANLTSLSLLGFPCDVTSPFNSLPLLTNLRLTGASLDNVDFSKFPNLINLSIKNSKISGLTKLSDITNITSLNKLQSLNVINVEDKANTRLIMKDLSGITNLALLKSLATEGGVISTVDNSIETIQGYVDDFSKVPNLKKLFLTGAYKASDIKNSSTLSKLNELNIADMGRNNTDFIPLFNSISSFPNLTSFISDTVISPELIVKMPKLTYLDVYSSGDINVSNNPLLKILHLKGESSNYGGGNKIGQVIGYDKLVNLEEFNVVQTTMPSFDFKNSPELKSVLIGDVDMNAPLDTRNDSCTTSSINVENNPNLILLDLNGCNFNKVDISANPKLKFLGLQVPKLMTFDASNNKKLEYLNVLMDGTTYTNQELGGTTTNMIKDLPISSLPTFKLPEQFILTSCDTLDSLDYHGYPVASIPVAKCENGKIIGFKAGGAPMKFNYSAPVAYNSSIKWSTNITVSDVSFNKYNYKKGTDYIFTGSDTKERQIVPNVNQKKTPEFPQMLSAVVNNNYLKLMSNQSIAGQYKIISVRSNSYEVLENDIKYNGTFDLNNLKITNAKAEVLNNKLIIKYGDEVVKEYNLIQKSNILGDVNGDGQITITDMTIQYKHVKYAMDLVGDEEYRANVNKDEDVSITDVLQLYKYIKNKITGF